MNALKRLIHKFFNEAQTMQVLWEDVFITQQNTEYIIVFLKVDILHLKFRHVVIQIGLRCNIWELLIIPT